MIKYISLKENITFLLILSICMLASCTNSTTTCNIKAFDFYQHAKSAGWEFGCIITPTLIGASSTFIPKPTGEIACVGSLGITPVLIDSRVDLHFDKPSWANPNNLLQNGWSIGDFESRVALLDNTDSVDVTYFQSGMSIVLQRTFKGFISGNYQVEILSLNIHKRNGDCSTWFDEAFNPIEN
ncbi:MAG: hypothetical protein O6849_08240 [Candidatus Dadabacteria bacterium]|jgi:hypothetical protein|nr:hypothetical protein [Candidatus Dadabacteria bacterium]